jgi:hypothetical protein
MIRRSDLLHFQETLVDIRAQIADLQRDARQERLEVQQMFRAIVDRLPPAARPSAPPPVPRRLHDVWFIFHTPLHYICTFFIRTLWAVRDLSLGVFYHVVHILYSIMQFILIMVYFSFVSLIL